LAQRMLRPESGMTSVINPAAPFIPDGLN
jgi:hypothetical protein